MKATYVCLIIALLGNKGNPVSASRWDLDEDSKIFKSTVFPDQKFAPSVGNGHLATNIFNSSVYMNGLYNGEGTDSHRARIPSWVNIRLEATLQPNGENEPPVYALNIRDGVFTVTIESERFIVRQDIYAHRFYTRAIVNQITIQSKGLINEDDLLNSVYQENIEILLEEGPPSTDIEFVDQEAISIAGRYISSKNGKTLLVENAKYQPNPSEVYVYCTDVPDKLAVPRMGQTIYTFVMAADKNKTVALKEITDVLQLDPEELYRRHIIEWKQRYDSGSVIVRGDDELSNVIDGAWYYLLSSLPSYRTNQPQDLFHGLSPGSLAKGGYNSTTDVHESYRGHSFWDTETWMYPPMLLLFPDLANQLLQYRLAMETSSLDNAKEFGYEGVRFAWESAFTGMETSPADETAIYEQHVTGCVSFAIRQYLAMTRDENFLQNGGCNIIKKIAQFWASRVTYNNNTGFYDINSVMGPDEYIYDINNSVFTNVVAGYSLYLGEYASCLCSSQDNEVNQWVEIAKKIALPYDAAEDYHPEYDGYERPKIVKQADVILLGFPLQYPMNQTTLLNDLNYYWSVNDEGGPAMSWGMYSIGFLQNGYDAQAEELFRKSYQTYIHEPFKVWSEANKNFADVGAINFITGMGGFLQTVLFGYGGIRIHLDRLEILRFQPPPGTEYLEIKGIDYLQTNFDLRIERRGVGSLLITSVDSEWPLEIDLYGQKVTLYNGVTVDLNGDGPFVIKSTNPALNSCPLPLDLIGQD